MDVIEMLVRESIQRMNQELKKNMIKKTHPLTQLKLVDGDLTRDYQSGGYFGKKNQYYTIYGEMTIPEEWQTSLVSLGIYSSETEWDNATNPQITLYLNDQLIQGLDVNHREVILPQELLAEPLLTVRLEIFSGREEKQFPLFIQLQELDQQTRESYFDFYVALESWRSIIGDSHSELIYQQVLQEASRFLDFRQPYSDAYYNGLSAASTRLQEDLYDRVDFQATATVLAVGHTHIDIAWLWTVAQAIEKGQRSFSTVLKLMEEYPDYTFIQSQPQMYRFIKEHYPELYQQIKQKIAEGRWEAEGAMWVEADCNLTSGESLVRQIVHGKQFIKEEFGTDSQVLWLPDVFGYSAALPQILKKTNTPYFMTTKLSWNQFNQIPYDTFYWQGIDGSEILTHFITTVSEGYSPTPYYTTYNGLLDPYSVKGSWDRYQQKDLNDEVLLAYGYGDGGGGPTREMLEVAKRLKNGLPGVPKVTSGFPSAYFQRLDETLKEKKVPRWRGELYFEYHRGTYTSMAKNKKFNRETETLLQSLEKLFVQFGRERYPQGQLTKMWQLTLLNQFHDTLPGSSIKEVYDQTDLEYQETRRLGRTLVTELLTDDQPQDQWFVYNPLAKQRDLLVELSVESDQSLVADGQLLRQQLTTSGKRLVLIPEMRSLSGCLLKPEKGQPVAPLTAREVGKQIETAHYFVTFDEQAEISSLIDKATHREIVPEGQRLNQLVAYEDLPLNFDAWDIDIFYQEKQWAVQDVQSVQLVEDGPIRQTIRIKRVFEASTIKQFIHFYHHSRRIDFETDVDWHQQHILLKAQFPIAINTLKATFDIQFGNVERAIHTNTSWDMARFEVCGQKWLDMSEGNYGVSMLTDCKYGFNVAYQQMGVTLIKSATDPNPEADQGNHQFIYAILPHEGSWQEAETVEEALDLNTPALVSPVGKRFPKEEQLVSFATVNQKNILLDTLKKAELEETLILRLYEFHNKRTRAQVKLNLQVERAVLCDLLENELEELAVVDNEVIIPFLPFEIQTIKLYIK